MPAVRYSEPQLSNDLSGQFCRAAEAIVLAHIQICSTETLAFLHVVLKIKHTSKVHSKSQGLANACAGTSSDGAYLALDTVGGTRVEFAIYHIMVLPRVPRSLLTAWHPMFCICLCDGPIDVGL